MSDYPYVDTQVVWDKPMKFVVDGLRGEDWFGKVGLIRRSGGVVAEGLHHLNNWNAWIRAMIKPGMTVMDVGANEGWTTCVFAQAVGPAGRVIAFEPDPENCRRIARNIELNGLANVHVHQRVVADVTGEARTFAAERVMTDGTGITVETVRLDDFAHDAPDVIKVDVEGMEWPVLLGSEKLLTSGVAWEVELHLSDIPGGVNMTTFFGFNPWDIMACFKRHGYTIRQDGVIVPDGTVPRHGSIWCSRGEIVVHAAVEP